MDLRVMRNLQTSIKTAQPGGLAEVDRNKQATEVLDSTSMATCTPDQSQALAKAYTASMRRDVMGMDEVTSDRMGSKLDELRGKAEGISEALGQVRV